MSQAPLYIVGGSGLFRRGLNSFIEGSRFAVAGEFDGPRECIAVAGGNAEPEIIIYISNGNAEKTGEAVTALVDAYRDARLMVLCADLSIDELRECLKAGAGGYLLSSISKEALIHSLTLIIYGETVFPSALAAAWLNGTLSRSKGPAKQPDQDLTGRELEILGCLTDGASNKIIARRLGISEATVKIHMKSLIRKLGVANRTQAALWALEAGFGADPFGATASAA